MKRREFIVLIGASAAWPSLAQAQRQPTLGLLSSGELADWAIKSFRAGLEEGGYFEGRNLTVIYRSAENQFDRVPALAAELLKSQVSVIFATGSPVPARSAKAATPTIPIVFAYGRDPVRDGLVASFNRPGGNVTGVVFFNGQLGAKRLELLRQLVPNATTIGVLLSPNTPEPEVERKDLQAAALAIGLHLIILDASSDRDIETAFATFVQRGAGALLVGSGAFLT